MMSAKRLIVILVINMEEKEKKFNNAAYFFREEEAKSFALYVITALKTEVDCVKLVLDNRTYYVVQYNYNK